MRLYPVIPMIFRKAMCEQRVGGYLIPKGTLFIVHIMATHTSDRYWERAADFLPVKLPFLPTAILRGSFSCLQHHFIQRNTRGPASLLRCSGRPPLPLLTTPS